MIIDYVNDGIENAPMKHIIHGCNTLGKMGAGAAKAIAEKWPTVKEVYQKSPNKHILGEVIIAPTHTHALFLEPKVITMVYNVIIQDRITGPLPRISYDALEKALISYKIQILNNIDEPVAITKIGCGLAGGDWSIVKDMLNEHLPTCKLYVYTGKSK